MYCDKTRSDTTIKILDIYKVKAAEIYDARGNNLDAAHYVHKDSNCNLNLKNKWRR